MTVYSDNFVDDYHICDLIIYMWHITLLNLALIPTKSYHAPLPKIQNTGM